MESGARRLRGRISAILDTLADAAPEATIVFLKTYNPFSLGTGIAFEEGTSLMVTRLNGLAAAAAE